MTESLHGNVRHKSPVALLLLDVLNDLRFPKNKALVRQIPGLGRRLSALKRRCVAAGIPVLYANDNKGLWRSDAVTLLNHCLGSESLGRSLVRRILPGPDDYLVLKPKHSAFYASPLGTLLVYLKTKTLILCGLTTDSCVLTTACDAFVRDLNLFIPADCIASTEKSLQRDALRILKKSLNADVTVSSRLKLAQLLKLPARFD